MITDDRLNEIRALYIRDEEASDIVNELLVEIERLRTNMTEIEEGKSVVVPVEPTYEMQNAGKWAALEYCDGDEELEEYAPDNDECALIYKAMIAAREGK